MTLRAILAGRRLDDGRFLSVYPELTGTACIAVNKPRRLASICTAHGHWRHEGPRLPSGDCGLRVTAEGHRDTECVWEPEWEDPDHDGGYDGYFQYPNAEEALVAFHAMTTDDEEPSGWHRAAPPSFRRRPGGDPAQEEVRP